MICSLYIDTDGSRTGTHVIVIGEDGTCLGELDSVHAIDYHLGLRSEVKLTLLKVPGRFLADEVLIETIKIRRWRQRLKRWWDARWRLPGIAS